MIKQSDKNITAALAYYVSVAVVLLLFSACGGNARKSVVLNTIEDTLAYSMGSMQKIQYMHYIETNCKVDSAYTEVCFEGIQKGYTDKELSPAYYDGINIGIQTMSGFIQINKKLADKEFVRGLLDGAFSKNTVAGADSSKMSDVYKEGLKNSGLLTGYVKELKYTGTKLDDFILGFKEGTSAFGNPEKYAFACGKIFGKLYLRSALNSSSMQIYGTDRTKSLSADLFYSGFMECNLPDAAIPHGKAKETALLADYKIKDSLYSDNRAEGERFLRENKKKPGVVTLPSGLQYKILKEGTGKVPSADSKVGVHYIGKTIEGRIFDDTHRYKEPVPLDLKHTARYFSEIVSIMPLGSVWEIYIPQNMAFASSQTEFFKPFSTIVYDVELIKIIE